MFVRLVSGFLLLVAIALGGFSWWGTSTATGRARYDEMDGLYPVGAGLLASICVTLALVLAWLAVLRARRRSASLRASQRT